MRTPWAGSRNRSGLTDRERVVARKETPDVAHEDGALNWHTEPLLAALAHYLQAVFPAWKCQKSDRGRRNVVFPACGRHTGQCWQSVIRAERQGLSIELDGLHLQIADPAVRV